jgi:hypothetical protein
MGNEDDFELVRDWSHIKFDRPVPLVPRGEVRVGDHVQSGHGYTGCVVEASTRGEGPGTTRLVLELHTRGSGVTRSEEYPADSVIPVLELTMPEAVSPTERAVLEKLLTYAVQKRDAAARLDDDTLWQRYATVSTIVHEVIENGWEST